MSWIVLCRVPLAAVTALSHFSTTCWAWKPMMLSAISKFPANSRTAFPQRPVQEAARNPAPLVRLAPSVDHQVDGNFGPLAAPLRSLPYSSPRRAKSGSITSRSRSLSGRASPRACEPKRMTSASGAAAVSRRQVSGLRSTPTLLGRPTLPRRIEQFLVDPVLRRLQRAPEPIERRQIGGNRFPCRLPRRGVVIPEAAVLAQEL